jgi:putative transposase
MKTAQFSDAQKAFILRQGADGVPSSTSAGRAESVRRPISIGRRSTRACSRLRMRRLKQLEDELSRVAPNHGRRAS